MKTLSSTILSLLITASQALASTGSAEGEISTGGHHKDYITGHKARKRTVFGY